MWRGAGMRGHFAASSPVRIHGFAATLAGEFQYGTFSVFINAAVVLIRVNFSLKFSEQAAALSIVHLVVLAAGAFLLARGRRLSVALSMLVAIVGALNGWIVCWGATDWFGALGAFAWLPWAWWALEKSLGYMTAAPREGRPSPFQRMLRAMIWPAPFVYLLITGGFPYTVVMLALLIAWLSLREIVQLKNWRTIFPMLFGTMLGVGLSAPAWLALSDYVHGSNRGAQSAIAHWQWLVSLRRRCPDFCCRRGPCPGPIFRRAICRMAASELAWVLFLR